MKRILTAVLLIPLVVGLVLWGPPFLLTAVVLAITELALWEFFRLAEGTGAKPMRIPGYALGALIPLIPALSSARSGVFWLRDLTWIVPVILLGWTLFSGRDVAGYLASASATLLGVFYVALPLALLVSLCLAGVNGRRDGRHLVLFGLVVVWVGDTLAFFIGRKWGRHKLAPLISPGKTWEGSAASFSAAIILGLLFILLPFLQIDLQPEGGPYAPWVGRSWSGLAGMGNGLLEAAILAAIINIAAQVGDLAESALKRNAGVKDSSQIVPGHGGVLDRIDALLFAAPVLWYYFILRIA